ncbi:MAG: T9SS type A sorting domain-containing protein [Bacteroidetes bacterium]|nr:T9SS type A sorting domain-containing protein [Bacteroidota bacterium]
MDLLNKVLFTICIVVTFITESNAQTFIIFGDKTFGTITSDNSAKIIYDGGDKMFLTGNSHGNINGDKSDPLCDTVMADVDLWMLAIDTSLNILWDKSIGGNNNEAYFNTILLNDNKLMTAARSPSDSSCEKSQNHWGLSNNDDYWICVIDSNGNKLWDKTLGGLDLEDSPRVIQLTTGDFVVGGTSSSPIGGNKTVPNYGFPTSRDFWLIKLDGIGNQLWDRVYGGDGNESSVGGNTLSLLPTENGSFILTGSTQSDSSGDISQPARGFNDIWMIKCDSTGNKLWDKRFGGIGQDNCNYVAPTNDNGYLLVGSTTSPQGGDVTDAPIGSQTDCWIIKIDDVGNKQWDKRYGGNNGQVASIAQQDYDGGYLIGAYTWSDSSTHVSEPSYGGQDYWMFKIDSIGNKMWDKRFGSTGYDQLTSFRVMPDTSILLCGWADNGITAVKTDPGKGGNDYWIVRFKYVDNSVGINSDLVMDNQFTISPNPTNGILNIKTNLIGDASFIVYNVVGEKIYQQKHVLQKQNILDFSFLNNAMYILKIQTDKYSGTIKFVKY